MEMGIFWHRRDLRPAPANLIPLYIPDLELLGAASQWWLTHALEDLKKTSKQPLVIRTGKPLDVLLKIAKKTNAKEIYWNAIWEAPFYTRDLKIKKALEKEGLSVHIFNDNYLIDPTELLVEEERPYRVFTPFYKTALKEIRSPANFPRHATYKGRLPSSVLKETKEKWMKKLEHSWIPTRAEGLRLLRKFVSHKAAHYAKERDFPSHESTSHLSPYLHFGQISIHEVWSSAKKSAAYRRQLLWREFASYFLFHFPRIVKENWNHSFDRFPWSYNRSALKKWQKGKTGYPIVDAGMRQLWETGWMHNRLRLIVASFLTKDLLIDWKQGEKWFWDTLVDADKGNNVLGWQWVAGCGPDAAPYFRIFNPLLQGEKFDPKGEYVRRFVPELKNMPNKWIHRPWEAPPEVLKEAGVVLGRTYPRPLIQHEEARKRALKAFHLVKHPLSSRYRS